MSTKRVSHCLVLVIWVVFLAASIIYLTPHSVTNTAWWVSFAVIVVISVFLGYFSPIIAKWVETFLDNEIMDYE